MLTAKVRQYVCWVRYVLDVSLRNKQYVIVNLDETGVSTVKQGQPGYVMTGLRRDRNRHHYKRPRKDRSNVKTTFMAAVCDQPHIQPHLPQVFLPKYTQNAAVPMALETRYGRQGYPFQFWHRTNGTCTPAVFRIWARGLRSAVQSFNADAWIVLVMDCHSSHLDLFTVQYLERMGFLTIVVPAALTWLLQPLDVYVFAEFKRIFRQNLEVATIAEVDGPLLGSWIASATKAAKSTIVDRDWSDDFDKLGLGLRLEGLRPQLQRYLGDFPVRPRLPRSFELARLLHRVPGAENVVRLHKALMHPLIRIRDLPDDARPPAARQHDIPDLPPSRKRSAEGPLAHRPVRARLQAFVRGQVPHDGLGGIVGPAAVQISVPHRRGPF